MKSISQHKYSSSLNICLLVLFYFIFSTQTYAKTEHWIKTLSPNYEQLLNQLQVNPDSVLKTVLAETLNTKNAKQKAQHYYLLSQIYYSLVIPKKSLKAAQTGLQFISLEQQPWLYHLLKLSEASAYDISGQPQKGLDATNQAINWAKQHNDRELLLTALTDKGYILISLVNYIAALDTLQQAYAMANEEGDTPKAVIAGAIALVYEYRKEGKLSIPFFKESLAYHAKHQNFLEMSIALYGLGKAHCAINDLKKCKQYLQESAQVSKQINDTQGEAYAIKELAGQYIAEGNFSHAETLLRQALKAFNQAENRYMQFDVNKVLSTMYLKMGQTDKASDSLKTAKSYVDSKSMPMQYLAILRLEFEILAKKGKFQQAYNGLKSVMNQEAKWRSKQSTEQLHRMRSQFELESKEKENLLLEKNLALKNAKITLQKKHNTTLQLLSLLALLFSLFLLFLAYKITQNKKYFQKLANFDGLTKLLTRSRAIELLQQEHSQSQRLNQAFCLAMLDLDYFKKINDQYGHAIGDQVLKQVGKLVQTVCCENQICGRFGGEEFIVGFPNTPLKKAKEKLEELRTKTLKISDNFPTIELKISLSIGLCANNQHSDIDSMIKCADEALYVAKNQGRNQLVVG